MTVLLCIFQPVNLRSSINFFLSLCNHHDRLWHASGRTTEPIFINLVLKCVFRQGLTYVDGHDWLRNENKREKITDSGYIKLNCRVLV